MIKSKFVRRAFTLAEVLITLAIIGVVAAMTIPSVIVNTNQQEFKTGLRKAVSVLNSAITLNKALTGESPYDNENLYMYLQQNMTVMKKSVEAFDNDGLTNYVFYTTDGMKYAVSSSYSGDTSTYSGKLLLHENKTGTTLTPIKGKSFPTSYSDPEDGIGCGSKGLKNNPDGTTLPPCIITVDVNGERKPNPTAKPSKVSDDGVCVYYEIGSGYYPKYAKPKDRLLTDLFSIMITDQGAIPYGVVAQKAMYQAQK